MTDDSTSRRRPARGELSPPSSWRERGTWALTGLVCVLFLVAGMAKLVGSEPVVANFQNWGYSLSFRVFIGICEVIAAIGVLLPTLAVSSCAGLMGILVGAIYTHLQHGESPGFAIAVLACVLLLAKLRWGRAFFTRAPFPSPASAAARIRTPVGAPPER